MTLARECLVIFLPKTISLSLGKNRRERLNKEALMCIVKMIALYNLFQT